jgi:hypothetical protein
MFHLPIRLLSVAHQLGGNLTGYSTYSNDFMLIIAEAQTKLNFSMSPIFTNAKMQFVISWGREPHDLDSHQKPTLRLMHMFMIGIGILVMARLLRSKIQVISLVK